MSRHPTYDNPEDLMQDLYGHLGQPYFAGERGVNPVGLYWEYWAIDVGEGLSSEGQTYLIQHPDDSWHEVLSGEPHNYALSPDDYSEDSEEETEEEEE